MLKFWISFSCGLLLLGCSTDETKPPMKPNQKELTDAMHSNKDSTLGDKDKAQFENIQLQVTEPIIFPSSPNIAMPILLEERYMDKDFPDNRYVNIAVIHEGQPQAKLLFHETMVIEQIRTYEPPADPVQTRQEFFVEDSTDDSLYQQRWPRQMEGLIFFEACRFRNKQRDYDRLYCYDLKNDQLRQLSPDGAAVIGYRFFPHNSNVLITYSLDTNGDGKYESNEDQNMSLVDFRSDARPATFLLPLDSLKQFKRDYSKAN